MSIPVIDIFAGPGGLGEGFSSLYGNDNERLFDIKLSIEKDSGAHETLRLRSFFRQFPKGKAPKAYYDIMRQKSWTQRKALIDKLSFDHPVEWTKAEEEAWCFELPYPEECDKKGNKKGGYTEDEIIARHEKIDSRIEQALGGQKDFLLIGGPPCQAYSLVGRARNQGISKADHRVHLYKEYLRIIAKHHPAVFVMENVKGLLSSEVEGVKMFDLIKGDLSRPSSVYPEFNSPEYRIYSLTTEPDEIDDNGNPVYDSGKKYLIKSEEYGIPQKRHRVILLGIRKDLSHPGEYLKPKDTVTLESVIGMLPELRSGINREFVQHHPVEKYSNGTPKRVYNNLNDSDGRWKNVIKGQIRKLKKWGDLSLNGLSDGPKSFHNGIGAEFVECNNTLVKNHPLTTWYLDNKLGGVANHESRAHLTQDLMRYMFAGLYVEKHGTFPRLDDYAKHHDELIPDHANVASGKFTDRFRVQVADEPATTVTSHISKDGHYFIHYDPAQCRSLTVREAARIQTFPDNYLFCGARTTQYHQVGNAVPPYLAKQIAEVVVKVFITF